jgi:hypothetical protein
MPEKPIRPAAFLLAMSPALAPTKYRIARHGEAAG